MKHAPRIAALIALAALIVAPVAFFYRAATLDTAKTIMLAATVVWFIAAPVWLGKRAM